MSSKIIQTWYMEHHSCLELKWYHWHSSEKYWTKERLEVASTKLRKPQWHLYWHWMCIIFRGRMEVNFDIFCRSSTCHVFPMSKEGKQTTRGNLVCMAVILLNTKWNFSRPLLRSRLNIAIPFWWLIVLQHSFVLIIWGEESWKRLMQMAQLLRQLTLFVEEFGVAVLITNQISCKS